MKAGRFFLCAFFNRSICLHWQLSVFSQLQNFLSSSWKTPTTKKSLFLFFSSNGQKRTRWMNRRWLCMNDKKFYATFSPTLRRNSFLSSFAQFAGRVLSLQSGFGLLILGWVISKGSIEDRFFFIIASEIEKFNLQKIQFSRHKKKIFYTSFLASAASASLSDFSMKKCPAYDVQ